MGKLAAFIGGLLLGAIGAFGTVIYLDTHRKNVAPFRQFFSVLVRRTFLSVGFPNRRVAASAPNNFFNSH